MLSNQPSTYLSKSYLKAFEEYNSNKITFFYIVLFENQEPISLAIIQILDYNFIESDFTSYSNKLIQKLSYHLGCLLKRNYLKIVVCGSAFLSGEHGIYIREDQDKKDVLEKLVKGIQKLIRSDVHLKNLTDVILIKDFVSNSLPISNRLKKYNFSAIKIDPNMVLELQPVWNSFEDYLSSFKSKFRVKAKKAYKSSSLLVEKCLTYEEILEHKNTLSLLYNNVIEKSSFNIGTLNLSTYAALKKTFPEQFIIRAYFLNGKIVGFMSAMHNNNILDAHFVGIDYSLNKEHAIYSRILYDYVQIGIKKKVTKINFGRTSGEIKSTLGAIPEDLTCYIRHKKSVANFLFKPFLKRIKPKPFEQRQPFKKEKPIAV